MRLDDAYIVNIESFSIIILPTAMCYIDARGGSSNAPAILTEATTADR